MDSSLFHDMLQMAWRKKVLGERIKYVLLAVIFFPFLLMEQRQAAQGGENEATNQSSSGDDVYPLF